MQRAAQFPHPPVSSIAQQTLKMLPKELLEDAKSLLESSPKKYPVSDPEVEEAAVMTSINQPLADHEVRIPQPVSPTAPVSSDRVEKKRKLQQIVDDEL